MENSNSQTHNQKSNAKKILIISAIVLLVVCAFSTAGYLAYRKSYLKAKADIAELQGNKDWQQQQLEKANSDILAAHQQIGDLNGQLTALTTYYPEDISYEQALAKVTIEDSQVYPAEEYLFPASYKLLLVDVLVRNDNNEDAYFSSSDLKLKDQSDYEYNTWYDAVNVALPGGKAHTEYLSLKPGEQSRGTIAYLITRDVETLKLYSIASGKVLDTISP